MKFFLLICSFLCRKYEKHLLTWKPLLWFHMHVCMCVSGSSPIYSCWDWRPLKWDTTYMVRATLQILAWAGGPQHQYFSSWFLPNFYNTLHNNYSKLHVFDMYNIIGFSTPIKICGQNNLMLCWTLCLTECVTWCWCSNWKIQYPDHHDYKTNHS